jgi:hypothetical protein
MPNTLGQGLNKFETNYSIRRLGLHMKCRGFYRLQAGSNVREGRGFAAFTATPVVTQEGFESLVEREHTIRTHLLMFICTRLLHFSWFLRTRLYPPLFARDQPH